MILYTRAEVAEAIALLRKYRNPIPDECIDQMEEVLYNARRESNHRGKK